MNKKGFTLVELLAVIVILSLLIVLASTTTLSLIRSTRHALKVKQFDSLLEAGESYIQDVVDGTKEIQPETSDGSTTTYTGYDFLEYVGTCDTSKTEYCWTKSDKTTRVIYFDSANLKGYIDTRKFDIDYTDPNNKVNNCKLKAQVTVSKITRDEVDYYTLDDITILARDGVKVNKCVK